MSSSPIGASSLHDLGAEWIQRQEEQKEDDKANEAYLARRKERRARQKELRELIVATMAASNQERFDAGDCVFTRDAAPTIKVDEARVKRHFGADRFNEYAEIQGNIVYDRDRVRVRKKRKR